MWTWESTAWVMAAVGVVSALAVYARFVIFAQEDRLRFVRARRTQCRGRVSSSETQPGSGTYSIEI
jgi:hypothetical protein